MQITEVRVYLPREVKETGVQATCSVTIDGVFVLHQVLVIKANNGSLFIRFPQEKIQKNGEFIEKDICHPLDTATRTYIQKTVIDTFLEVTENEHDKTAVSGQCTGENCAPSKERAEV